MNRVIKKVVRAAAVPIILGAAAFLFAQVPASPLRFVILGDRTGETVPGMYEAVWKEIVGLKPAFVAGVGDSIQGLDEATAEKEWIEFDHLLDPFRKIPYYPAAGNHDVWSDASAKLFEKHAGRPVRYGFDNGPVHFTVLDTSRSDSLAPEEMAFLEQDLKANQARPVKFILSHRPSWILNVVMQNAGTPLQQIAEKYGVKYIVAGHVHEMMHFGLGGVEYISVPSAGGHLRASGQYEDGWFFGYIVATVNGRDVKFEVHELAVPNGLGRVTSLSEWGAVGLLKR